MDHTFTDDIAVIGAGHIGLPWAAVLATELDLSVTCIDIDESRVRAINSACSPFNEPQLEELLEEARAREILRATTDPSALSDHKYVASTINAKRHQMEEYIDVIREYRTYLVDGQIVVNRTTLPVGVIARIEELLIAGNDTDLTFTVLPERLAEGKAVSEIKTLPKIVGARDEAGRGAMRALLEPLESPLYFTDPETAMFIKLIDNTYRDGLFAISNQIAYIADILGLDGHEAISLANAEYPRNNIPTPGLVGGKCLPKDPHFLMDETICDQPTTPDLFSTTRRTNASLPAYITTEILKKQPETVAVLGVTYKRDIDDLYNSPPLDIAEGLSEQGIDVNLFDPNVDKYSGDLDDTVANADVILLAMNHSSFDGLESRLNKIAVPSAEVYDVWGLLEPDQLELTYDGFGIDKSDPNQVNQADEWMN